MHYYSMQQTTPVPNILFDVFLKNLKGAELKVLLVVIRQTLGWRDPLDSQRRKQKDWISGSQLRLRTGCSRKAISSAIESLVKQELIEVSDGYKALHDAKHRKGKTRLYFRLFPVLDTQPTQLGIRCVKEGITTAASEKFTQQMRNNIAALVQKVRITKETLQN